MNKMILQQTKHLFFSMKAILRGRTNCYPFGSKSFTRRNNEKKNYSGNVTLLKTHSVYFFKINFPCK
ncbi:hypothetical protein TNCT_299221 [Trichonephila clavata]|uniref:Uncharacterized protein n=1 Tax=Trichonephila clavata TaxID=2740835 RepID=A0A8X6LE13_TRICU|nr:hypothetical protein TNCT_299221 [Trichonephila clavata]